jgi:hypothetical protein
MWGRRRVLSEQAMSMRGEEVGRGTMERLHMLTWPYEIKTDGEL